MGHVVFPTGLEIAKYGHALSDLSEIIEAKRNPGGVGHRQQVKDRVGGSTQGDDHGDSILKGFPGHYVPWFDIVGN